MKLRNVRLTLANVARTTNEKSLSVNSVSNIYKMDEHGKRTDIITGYKVTCSAYRGDELAVKFPAELKEKIDALKAELENDVEIKISFSGLKLTPYALKANNGDVLSGVSAKADDFEITYSGSDEIDIDI